MMLDLGFEADGGRATGVARTLLLARGSDACGGGGGGGSVVVVSAWSAWVQIATLTSLAGAEEEGRSLRR
jgi:hypothetical protein